MMDRTPARFALCAAPSMTLAAVESKNGTAEQSRMKFLRWSAMRPSTVPTVEAAPKKKAPEMRADLIAAPDR